MAFNFIKITPKKSKKKSKASLGVNLKKKEVLSKKRVYILLNDKRIVDFLSSLLKPEPALIFRARLEDEITGKINKEFVERMNNSWFINYHQENKTVICEMSQYWIRIFRTWGDNYVIKLYRNDPKTSIPDYEFNFLFKAFIS